MKHLAASLFAASVLPQQVWSDSIGTVATVNAPLAYIAEVLGTPQLEVIYPVPRDVDPAYWSPSDDVLQTYQQADLILLNGAGYAAWVEDAVLARSRLVNTTRQVQDRLIPSESGIVHKHGPEGEHVHSDGFKFTTWLDPDMAVAQVDAAAAGLSRRWPDLADQIYERAQLLHAEIDEMDNALSAFAQSLQGRQVFASHPVYSYFERAYSLPVTSLHWESDLMPEEAEWTLFSTELDPGQTPTIIWEGTPIRETADRLGALGVDVIVLDPMANPDAREDLFRRLGAQVRQTTQ